MLMSGECLKYYIHIILCYYELFSYSLNEKDQNVVITSDPKLSLSNYVNVIYESFVVFTLKLSNCFVFVFTYILVKTESII